MSRPRSNAPKLSFHRHAGQWFCRWQGKHHYFGPDRKKAEKKWLALIGQPASSLVAPLHDPGGALVAEALLAYEKHAQNRYSDRKQRSRIKMISNAVDKRHGHLLVAGFRGRMLNEVYDDLVKRELSKRYIRHLLAAFLACARWWKINDYISVETLGSLREQVTYLLECGGGRLTAAIEPVPDRVVDATLPTCAPIVADMIRIQRETAMRPGELCAMTGRQISTSPAQAVPIAGLDRRIAATQIEGVAVWFYCPSKHKNLHRGKPRIIAIGPAAQALLKPYLTRGEDEPLFLHSLGGPFTSATYGNAIWDAIRKANANRKPEEKIPRWSPNQLRKAAATQVDDGTAAGADAAAALLGHSASRRALGHYVQCVIEQAAKTAAKVG